MAVSSSVALLCAVVGGVLHLAADDPVRRENIRWFALTQALVGIGAAILSLKP